MFQRFLVRCLLLSLPIATGLGAFILWNRDYIPAPRLTANVAINEQIHRIAGMPEAKADVLALGSSMTLNNLASAPVTEHFGTTRYVNAGAWGFSAGELVHVAPVLVEHLKPHTMIVVTNLMDFQALPTLTDDEISAMSGHLLRGGSPSAYLRHWDATWFLRQMELNRIRFTDPGNYEFLGFDEHGAATLEVPEDRILRSRYDAPPPRPEELREECYVAFAAFAAYLHEQGIRLFVFQSPYRAGIRSPASDSLTNAHVERLRTMLEPMGHRIANGSLLHWPDGLFSDASHLDHAGADTFTTWCLEQLSH